MILRALAALAVCALGGAAAAAPLSVALVVDGTDAAKIAPRVSAEMKRVLDLEEQLSVRAIEVAETDARGVDLAAADDAFASAQRSFSGMDIDPAKKSLVTAIAAYEDQVTALARRGTGLRPLRDAHILLAKIRFFEANPEGAQDALRRAFVLDPKLVYATPLFPPQMKRVVIEARLLFDTLGSAKVEVASEPPGAEVRINGRSTGVRTPATIETVAGPNTIELELAGHARWQTLIDVSSNDKGDAKVTHTLVRRGGVEARCREVTAALGTSAESSLDLDALAKSLSVDAILFVHVDAPAEQRFRLIGATYQRRAKNKTLTRAERVGGDEVLESEAQDLARQLAEPLTARAPLAHHGEHDSNKKVWWIVGGTVAVLVVGAAVGISVGLTEHQTQIAREIVLLGAH